ncbi:MAG: TolC family protein [Chitinophagaceae bacterium]
MFKRKQKTKLLKQSVLAGCTLFLSVICFAQSSGTLTIAQCYELAKANYPLAREMALIEKTKEYTIDNISKGYLPQLNLYGQATYQSAVTQIPISLPNVSIPVLSKDQYKTYGEIYQPLTDGYTIQQQKQLVTANAATELQKLAVELYKLKERINQLFFGILLVDAQVQQTVLLKKDIQSGIEKTNAAIANGTALKSNSDILRAELLKTDQRSIELKANRKGFTDMLAIFINQPVNEHTTLLSPLPSAITPGIKRPELQLYEVQKNSFTIQDKLIRAKNLPRIGVFAQGGYGKPGLNFLSNEFSLYYIGGLKLNWNFSGLYTAKKEKAILKINQASIDIQKETFLLNMNLVLSQQNSEVLKLQELIDTDKEIIELREKIKQTSGSQLQNGILTSIDYLAYVNAEDQARQNMVLHQVQLLLAEYNYQTTSGN